MSKFKSWMFFFLVFLNPSLVLSDTPPSIESSEPGYLNQGLDTQNISNGIQRTSYWLNYRDHRHEIFSPYPEEKDNGIDLGGNFLFDTGMVITEPFDSEKGEFLWSQKISPHFSYDLIPGVHTLNRHFTGEGMTLGTLSATIKAIYSWNLFLELDASKDFVYPQLLLPGGVTNFIWAYMITPQHYWYLTERLRLVGRYQYWIMSDGNGKNDEDLSMSYAICNRWPSIWVGVGGEYMTFNYSDPNYWSPIYYVSDGLRTEANFSLFNEISALINLNLSQTKEQGDEPTFGYYFSAAILFGLREKNNFSFRYVRALAEQAGVKVTVEELTGSYMLFF